MWIIFFTMCKLPDDLMLTAWLYATWLIYCIASYCLVVCWQDTPVRPTHYLSHYLSYRKSCRSNSPSTFSSPLRPYLQRSKITSNFYIFKLKLLSLVYESVSMVAPVCFHNFFFLNSTLHCHNTRQSTRGDLFLANVNTSQYGLKSIRYLGAKLWNELPIAIRTQNLLSKSL